MNRKSKFYSSNALRLSKRVGGGLLTLMLPLAASAQSASTPATVDKALVDQLLKRLDKQEEEIRQLKSKLESGSSSVSETSSPKDTFPKLQFHGFGDVTYKANNQPTDKNSFVLGQLDFFVTSQLSDKVSVLSESVIEAGGANDFGIEIERLLLQYDASDYFKMDIGRYHTAVGYYNTAYHHGAWFQTATGRPAIFDFEDGGGIIPTHNVGISMHGDIPSGKLGLQYIAEVGNGRAYQPPGVDQNLVLNVQDDNDYKAFNLALIARPEGIPGLQVGAGAYHDTITSVPGPRIDELMLSTHAVYKTAAWEFLSESHFIRHEERAGATHWSSAAFGQVGRKFGDLTPYARISYFNSPDTDPVYTYIGKNGVAYGPAVGLRYDFTSLAAFKIQYDHQEYTTAKSLDQITLQVAFTF